MSNNESRNSNTMPSGQAEIRSINESGGIGRNPPPATNIRPGAPGSSNENR